MGHAARPTGAGATRDAARRRSTLLPFVREWQQDSARSNSLVRLARRSGFQSAAQTFVCATASLTASGARPVAERCIEAGLASARQVAVDGGFERADASHTRCVVSVEELPREDVPRAMREYLADLVAAAPDPGKRPGSLHCRRRGYGEMMSIRR